MEHVSTTLTASDLMKGQMSNEGMKGLVLQTP
jgi:hypothetical protein